MARKWQLKAIKVETRNDRNIKEMRIPETEE